jgi:hypothetical protein
MLLLHDGLNPGSYKAVLAEFNAEAVVFGHHEGDLQVCVYV